MRPLILLLALSAAFFSCTSSYKTGQTPDDVYYSPQRPQEEYVRVDKEDDRRYYSSEDYYDDRYLRMKVRNRSTWSELGDWYSYDRRYTYGYYNYEFTNPWSPYSYWNYYYNPYCSRTIIVNPKTSITYNKPRTFNLNTYNSNQEITNKTYNPKSSIFGNSRSNSSNNRPRVFGNNSSSRQNGSNSGNFLRNIFNGNNNSSNSSSNNNSSTPSRSSSSSSSSSSGSSGSSGSSAPVRRF